MHATKRWIALTAKSTREVTPLTGPRSRASESKSSSHVAGPSKRVDVCPGGPRMTTWQLLLSARSSVYHRHGGIKRPRCSVRTTKLFHSWHCPRSNTLRRRENTCTAARRGTPQQEVSPGTAASCHSATYYFIATCRTRRVQGKSPTPLTFFSLFIFRDEPEQQQMRHSFSCCIGAGRARRLRIEGS